MHPFCLFVHLSRYQNSRDNNSYLRKYCSYDFETLPQHKAFIGASRKNINYTLRIVFLVN